MDEGENKADPESAAHPMAAKSIQQRPTWRLLAELETRNNAMDGPREMLSRDIADYCCRLNRITAEGTARSILL